MDNRQDTPKETYPNRQMLLVVCVCLTLVVVLVALRPGYDPVTRGPSADALTTPAKQ